MISTLQILHLSSGLWWKPQALPLNNGYLQGQKLGTFPLLFCFIYSLPVSPSLEVLRRSLPQMTSALNIECSWTYRSLSCIKLDDPVTKSLPGWRKQEKISIQQYFHYLFETLVTICCAAHAPFPPLSDKSDTNSQQAKCHWHPKSFSKLSDFSIPYG